MRSASFSTRCFAARRRFYDDPDSPPLHAELVRKHLHEQPRDLRLERTELPVEVWSFVQRLLAKDRDDRFATAAHALEAARALCARHAADADIFRTELGADSAETGLIELAPLTERMTAPPASDGDVSEDDGPPTEADPSSHGTERLRPEGEPLDPWEERQLAHLRTALRAPRIFRDPAVAKLDPTTGRILEMQPLESAEPAISSAIRVRQDRSLMLDLSPLAQLEGGLDLHAATTGAGEIVHGTRFTCGGAQYQLLDRAVVEPSLGTSRHRSFAPLLAHESRQTGALQSFIVLKMPLAVIGSLPVCDLVVPGAAAICAAVWLRGGGELELAHIDISQLPYGQPVTACRFINERRVVQIGGDDALRIYERNG
jgi:hypothetical protein